MGNRNLMPVYFPRKSDDAARRNATPLQPRLAQPHLRALRVAVQQMKRAYRDNGFANAQGARIWIGLAEEALGILERERTL